MSEVAKVEGGGGVDNTTILVSEVGGVDNTTTILVSW